MPCPRVPSAWHPGEIRANRRVGACTYLFGSKRYVRNLTTREKDRCEHLPYGYLVTRLAERRADDDSTPHTANL